MARLLLPPLLLLLLAWGAAAVADQFDELLDFAEGGRVVEVIDGDTLVLDDGAEVRLVGTQAPKLSLGRAGFKDWPLAAEARAYLVELVEGREVELGFGGRESDRHGRLLAHVFRSDDLWLQGAMVEAGLARVYGFEDNRALLGELYALERAARAARRGIWANPFYAVLTPAALERDLPKLLDSFQLVEGRVLEAAEIRGRGYLNFGEDWRRDLTASLSPEALDLFAAEGIALESYSGRLVRLRGWVEDYNGPMISITHPEQLEVLE